MTQEVGAQPSLDPPQCLQSLYYERIAPIVAIWLQEVNVAMVYVKIEREFPPVGLEQGVPSM